jgi:hypothetical protein
MIVASWRMVSSSGRGIITLEAVAEAALSAKACRTGHGFLIDRELIKAVAYLRTSSAANVGADKDSDRRQREALEAFARRAGYEPSPTPRRLLSPSASVARRRRPASAWGA